MRRAAPWILVGVVLLGAGLGTGLGLAMQPAANGRAFLLGILASTRGARSARFTFITVSHSSRPILRATATGFGLVDFRSHEFEETTFARGVSLGSAGADRAHPTTSTNVTQAVSVGGAQYIRVPSASGSPLGASVLWIKVPGPTGADRDVLRSVLDLASTYESVLSAPDVQVQNLGASNIGRVQATEYSVSPNCVAPSLKRTFEVALGPLDVWIDRGGRLVQIRSSMSATIPRGLVRGQFGADVTGTSVIVNRLRFDDFGVPVHLSVPTPNRIALSGSTGASAVIRWCA